MSCYPSIDFASLNVPNRSQVRVGIVQASFHAKIGHAMRTICIKHLQNFGVLPAHIYTVMVPGSLEIPIALQYLARKGMPNSQASFDVLIAFGVVIRGQTYHFDVVADESAAGVMRVSLDEHIPIVNSILTLDDETQAEERMDSHGLHAAWSAMHLLQLFVVDRG